MGSPCRLCSRCGAPLAGRIVVSIGLCFAIVGAAVAPSDALPASGSRAPTQPTVAVLLGIEALLFPQSVPLDASEASRSIRKSCDNVRRGVCLIETASIELGGPLAIDIGKPVPGAQPRSKWRVLRLRPGTYALRFRPIFTRATGALAWLDVPSDQPIVYAGTVTVLYYKPRNENQDWSRVEIADEGDSADRAARSLLRTGGLLARSLAHAYSPHQPLWGRGAVPTVLELQAAGGARPGLEGPDWRSRSVAHSMAWMEGGASGLGALGALFYMALAYPAAAIKGSSDEKHWEPCIRKIAETLDGEPIDETLRRAVESRLPPSPSASMTTTGAAGRLTARVGYVRLVNCVQRTPEQGKRRWKAFSIAVGLWARLETPGESATFVARTYSNVQAIGAELEYAPRLEPDPPCREMPEYCSEQGPALVLQDLNMAVDLFADSLVSPPTCSQASP